MDQEFIKLVQLLLGNQGNLITHYGAEINKHVASLNKDLNLKDDFEFKGNHKCSEDSVNQVVAPVVFASSGEQPVFAYFGLNPYFDSTAICIEKDLAGNNLDKYAAFYNSGSCNGAFDYVFNIPRKNGGYKISPYYQNLLMVLNSLRCGKYIPWGKFSRQFPDHESRIKNCIDQINACPIIVPELIPFHSAQTSISYASYTRMTLLGLYQNYHKKLFDILDQRMHPDGVIFIHGSATSKIARLILDKSLYNVVDYPNSVNATYTLATWEKRVVVILNSTLRSRKGVFNSNEDIRVLIETILNYMKTHGKHFPCECTATDNPQTHHTPTESNIPTENNNEIMAQNNAGETTEWISTFTYYPNIHANNPKGLVEGDRIRFNLNGKGSQDGQILTIRRHLIPANRGKKVGDELAKIKVDGGKIVWRFLVEITKKLP